MKLSQAKGTVDQTPIFGTASTSKPCPDGFGSDAAVRIGPPGGPYQNVATPLREGGYDKKAVSAKPNRSFSRAIGGAPANGEWWVVVECWSLTLGRHPELFITPLTVTGRDWKMGQPAGGASSTRRPRRSRPCRSPTPPGPPPPPAPRRPPSLARPRPRPRSQIRNSRATTDPAPPRRWRARCGSAAWCWCSGSSARSPC
ncbi:hypothetical protein ACFQ1L_11375 [Phytohabitans flavus]|uniref:hypothetical protein n=1 Tax=Phytohabitans flavus TaxID=1076124 RepID=UPI003637FD7E